MGNRALLILFLFLISGCGSNPVKNHSASSRDAVFVRPKYPIPNASPTPVLNLGESAANASEDSTKSEGFMLAWPLKSHPRMSRGFDEHLRKPHEGLDLPAPKGTNILAAAAGRVIYAGNAFHGYGKMILVDHSSGKERDQFASLYAHCSKILVKSGQLVKLGQVLGLVGRTGHAKGTHLHFEVRLNRAPVDPLRFLPQ